MADRKDIPHMLHLLDDESPLVRERVETELRAFGPEVEEDIYAFLPRLNEQQQEEARQLAQRIRRDTFHQNWFRWLEMPDEAKALEFALAQLAYLEHGFKQPPLGELLDELEQEFRSWTSIFQVPELMDFLFLEKRFGPPVQAYYHPDNSNLVHVIQHREGIQISLSCLSILLADRLGLELLGLNVPGHFMVMEVEGGELCIYDCFNEGKRLDASTQRRIASSLELDQENYRELRALPHEIVLRILRNIINARFRLYGRKKSDPYVLLLEELVKELKNRKMLR
jgi:regulator of sirC expression with transglutaminase-like and TPR domain